MPRRRRPALTLGGMRALGANSLQVFCTECGATRTLDVSKFPNSLTVSWFGGILIAENVARRPAFVRFGAN